MRVIEKVSRLMYKKVYSRYKYKGFLRNPTVRRIIFLPYALLNIFYEPFVMSFYKKQINAIPKGTQIFFIGRNDFGTYLYMLHYLRLWQQTRSPVALLVFTKESEKVITLAQLLLPGIPVICPNRFLDHLISILFGHQKIFGDTFLPSYATLAVQRPDFLHMFDLAESPYAKYNSHLDPCLVNVEGSSLSKEFIDAYKKMRVYFDYNFEVFKDYCHLNYQTSLPKLSCPVSLKEKLGLTDPYVIMNINTKVYPGSASRRTINYPERYECLIDDLIQKGYQVVIQGRNEQPAFSPRSGLLDYSRNGDCSIENDLALYAGCEFVIASKSGVEIYATICDAPVLGLNYTEILGMQPSKKMRFYPKFLKNMESGHILPWNEQILSPCFFDMGSSSFSSSLEYVDMQEEDMLEALHEFLLLLNRPEDEWTAYTDQQKQFKNLLTPLHMELYLSKAVPCDTYFTRTSHSSMRG